MRKIKFRGYNEKNKCWLYGYYFCNRGEHFIAKDEIVNPFASADDFIVNPESIGEFTGVHNGDTEIYEGDIVSISNFRNDLAVVEWNDEQAAFIARIIGSTQWYHLYSGYKVVGHIYNSSVLNLKQKGGEK